MNLILTLSRSNFCRAFSGEYSALVCSEALDFNDALYLLHERGKAMQDSSCWQRRHDCYSWLKFEDINKLLKKQPYQRSLRNSE